MEACYPRVKVMRLKLWQARFSAKLMGRMESVSRLIGYFDGVGELGDPAESSALLGAPSTRLSEWIGSQSQHE